MSTWLITGCSTGLGRALAEAVIAAGHNAVVTARDAEKVADLAVDNTDRVLALPLDVTDTTQITNAVSQAEEKIGGVDVLVNNAGYGYRAAVEEGDDADIRKLFETQFFGAVAVIKAVLPEMRARRSGAIVNISTIGVQIMPAGSGYYAASKAALEGMSGSLYGELKPLGISVTVVEPGAFRTDFAGRSLTQSSTVIEDYADTAGKRRKEHDTVHGTQPGDPAKAAKAIVTAVESDEPPAFLLLGNDALNTYRRVPKQDSRASRLGNTSPQAPTSSFKESGGYESGSRPSAVKPVRRRSVLEKREYGDDPTMDGCSRDAQLGEDRVDVLLHC
jgi:NAD(P)-dependent dehydrogenase (short-subunit alcohol dehydrogenase family)